MKKTKTVWIFSMTCLIFVFFIFSCKNKKEEEATPEDSFDKSGMLANYADNLIVPSYSALKISIDSLAYLNSQFVSNPVLSSLTDLQSGFQTAYLSYQQVSVFEFGPAETELLRASFNVFPCDTVQINSNISSGIYDLASASNADAKGLPALDFLLYGSSQNNTQVLAKFTTATDAANAKTYLTALINELKTKSDAVNAGWVSYASGFKSNTGSDVSGSIGQLVNQLNYDFELLKNSRIGIPLGKKTLGVPLPEKAEAFYSQQSLVLAMKNLESIENIYLGRDAQNNDRLGLDDYLVHAGAQYTSGTLNDAIKNKFVSAKSKLALISGPLSQAVVSDPATVDLAYAELQQLVVLLKVDMPSALGVLITYQDNDGD
ncbi:MAG: imelysin family protein [Bacteroidia bacterium]|nr:imelysin family protein [Bacteroidia bacterium]